MLKLNPKCIILGGEGPLRGDSWVKLVAHKRDVLFFMLSEDVARRSHLWGASPDQTTNFQGPWSWPQISRTVTKNYHCLQMSQCVMFCYKACTGKVSILVHLCCSNRISMTRSFIMNRKILAQSSGRWKSKRKVVASIKGVLHCHGIVKLGGQSKDLL
jgi:hypothetical protein